MNQHPSYHPAAAIFFMRVKGDMVTGQDVKLGDLLMVDGSPVAQDGCLVIAAVAGTL